MASLPTDTDGGALYDPLDLSRRSLAAQEQLLESVAVPLLATAAERVESQEEELTEIIRPLIRQGQALVAAQEERLQEVMTPLINRARNMLFRQEALLADLPDEATDGEAASEPGREERPTFRDDLEDTPPGGGGGGGLGCQHREDIVPQFDSPCFVPFWDAAAQVWRLRGINGDLHTPRSCFPGIERIDYLDGEGALRSLSLPPDEWPIGNITLVMPEPRSTTPMYQDCEFTASVGTTGTGRRSGGQLPPPTERPPDEPPPPREPPPGEIQPPPIGGGGTIQPPRDPSCEYPLCGVLEGGLIWSRPHTVPPIPAPYWLRIRCLSGCTADVQCVQYWCAPAAQEGWHVVGPYLYGCPAEGIILDAIRAVCQAEGTIPPEEIEPERPPWVIDPPPRQPPPDFREPPPVSECEKPKAIRPQLRSNVYVPTCKTYEEWMQPIVEEVEGYGDIGDLAASIGEALAGEWAWPTHLTEDEVFGE